MTTTRSMPTGKMTIGEIIGAFATGEPPLRIGPMTARRSGRPTVSGPASEE